MAAFHSDDAFDRLKTLPVVKNKDAVEPNTVTKNFRAFRKELVRNRDQVAQIHLVNLLWSQLVESLCHLWVFPLEVGRVGEGIGVRRAGGGEVRLRGVFLHTSDRAQGCRSCDRHALFDHSTRYCVWWRTRGDDTSKGVPPLDTVRNYHQGSKLQQYIQVAFVAFVGLREPPVRASSAVVLASLFTCNSGREAPMCVRMAVFDHNVSTSTKLSPLPLRIEDFRNSCKILTIKRTNQRTNEGN